MSTKDSLHKSPTSILIVLVTVFTIFLTGCTSGPSQAVTSADNLVKAFITASEAKDINQYVSLFSEDARYMDYTGPTTSPMYLRDVRPILAQRFNDPAFSIKVESYFISSDGASAAVRSKLTYKNSQGDPASAPVVVILQIKDGKVVRQDNFYDSRPFE